MTVTFVLPGYSDLPIGGFRVAYQFASGLAARGHAVSVLHPHSWSPRPGVVNWLKRTTWPQRTRRRRPLVPWCTVHPDVHLRLVPDLRDRTAPDADCVIATAWQTAAAVRGWSQRKGRKFCLVADYEHWAVASSAVRSEMSDAFSGLCLLACGPAVRRMLALLGHEPLAEVRFGPDDDIFGLDAPMESRGAVVGFPVREEAFKGAWDAIAAVSLLRLRRPDIQFCAFGRIPLSFAPSWLDYSFRPSDGELRRFYNRLAIFLHPSHYEAWPLPPLEAMSCGASLLAADSIGVLGYAQDGHNATVVPAGRPDLLADAADNLLGDHPRRIRLAREGQLDAGRYRWSTVIPEFERLIADAVGPGRAP